MKTLDKSRDYAQNFGDTQGRIYEQDGISFGADGKEWVDPAEAPAEPVKPTKARAIHATPLATAAPAVDDQLAAQLKG